ncbi:hypothetical protein [Amycolatopsis regifaucium]|uniref:tetratricopeptide repeat protein n=1 Tax=Amycolatopsis regifaucium TaxID=546365 RepID=UPI0031345D0B
MARLESAVEVLRAVDYRQGGGFCRDTVDILKTVGLLLRWSSVPDSLRPRLLTVLADVHNLLGWTEFDTGRPASARLRFRRAAELSAEASNGSLTANIHYRLGRLELHYGDPRTALAQFARGCAAARRSGSPRGHAISTVNQAWALAKCNEERRALDLLTAAESEFADWENWHSPQPWEAFFGRADMAAMRGTVLTELAYRVTPRHGEEAIAHLVSATDAYHTTMARSRALTTIMLAQNHALLGQLDEAIQAGTAAVELADALGSVRTKDRLAPLTHLLAGRTDTESRDLLGEITRFRAEPAKQQRRA